MTEYVRLMHHYMSTGGFGTFPPPMYDLPFYPHHPGFGAEACQNMNFNSSTPTYSSLTAGHMSFPPSMSAVHSIPNAPAVSSPWQQGSMEASIHAPSTIDAQFFDANSAPSISSTNKEILSLKTEESAPSPIVDSPGDGKEEDTPTLSPSSYFWQELVLPGCNDATGTCQCGDGCECVGCLTHGGHNGVPLEAAQTAEQDTFPGFAPATNDDLNGNGSNQFLSAAFSEAPT